MIKKLYPRCPFENIDDELQKIHNIIMDLYHPKDLKEYWDKKRIYPEYEKYMLWRGLVEGIASIVDIDEIAESEYYLDSAEWNEYISLMNQIIYEKNLSYDSPEWQSVIEKYRRKDGKSIFD